MATERRHLTFDLPLHQVQHLDARAAYNGCSRAAYIRRLVVEDLERHLNANANTAQG